MRIKTKLGLGTGFLFIVILIFGILSLASINRLKTDAGSILQNNYETLVYNNAMLEALDKMKDDAGYEKFFEQNLTKQEGNITERGEKNATLVLRENFNLLKSDKSNELARTNIRRAIHDINNINQAAIANKNRVAMNTAKLANYWLMIIFTILVLVTFTIAVNFPGIISRPIVSLNEGIRAIVNKDYRKRIHLDQQDEFGELAKAFNTMAEKLDEYEHSNVAKIAFEKSRIETIINQMKDGIIGLDENKNFLFLNAAAQTLIGLKEADIAGDYAPDVALRNDLVRTLLQQRTSNSELKIFADNKESYFYIDVLDVTVDNKIIGEVIILRNITSFHELNQAKTNFIATVSHELKTPIASIKISSQLLGDHRVGLLNAEQEELVKSIDEDGDRLLKITSELLNMSQVETGQLQLKIELVSFVDVVNQSIDAVQYLLQQKSVRISKLLQPALPLVLGDKEKTSWVLVNFLTNAIRHSPDGDEIVVETKIVANKVQLLVHDHGKGIEQQYLSRIFDRYYRVPGRPGQGTGLGLAIAKEFMEAQGGRVWVTSEPGTGSTFGLELTG